MFNLEHSIAEWRQQMLADGIKTPVPLQELESHLREEIEGQLQLGVNEQQAFETGRQRIGYARELNKEFKKTCGANYDSRQQLLRMGTMGLPITIILNLLGRFVFHRSSSIYFSPEWWEGWSSVYIFWAAFTIIGFGRWMLRNKTISR